jgi:hypothetical protein
MKIKDIIKKLEDYRDRYGENLEIVLSIDAEGNSYSTLNEKSFGLVIDDPERKEYKAIGIVLYPWEEHFYTAEDACYNRRYRDEK